MFPFSQQFQSFSQYRCKTAKKSEEEIEFLRSNPKIWNVHSVLNVLHSLVDKSNINGQLEVYTSGGKDCSEIYLVGHLYLHTEALRKSVMFVLNKGRDWVRT